MFDAAIFDMDGLLIDSEPLWQKAEIKVFATVGLTLDAAQCRETTGVRIDEVVRIRHRQQPWHNKSLLQVEQEIMAEVQHLAVTEGQSLPGARELLAILAARGLPLALASASPMPMIEAVIAHLDLTRYFTVLCSAADEAEGKPHPAVYLSTARRLGVDPRHCIAFEDSIPGLQSARAAGMTVVAVPDPWHFDRSEYALADLKVPSLTAFIDSDLMTRLRPRMQSVAPVAHPR